MLSLHSVCMLEVLKYNFIFVKPKIWTVLGARVETVFGNCFRIYLSAIVVVSLKAALKQWRVRKFCKISHPVQR